ncbi:MAG: Rieske (2Fe-2S) protein [Rhodospirillales bacterium]|nr:Rieske (2Fe-2S) protein [Rhodospirillales bacterium]MSP80976.1 Rieske (2Fe-2S) protein [Rhodospirillales bacterium]
MSGVVLCPLAAIADGESNGFIVTRPGGARLGVLAVRRGKQVHAYVNSCPHTGAPLDFQPGQFLTLDKTLIQCSTHGALFRIEDGFCVQGPCAGKSIVPVAVVVKDGTVRLSG